MRMRLSSVAERLRASLFFIPMVAVLVAVVVGQVGITIDNQLHEAARVPFVWTSTVQSARVVLSTIASATITFAGVAFSVSLLVIQLGSGQYSPRVVHTLFRDPFNKRVMGLVVGTFTYCLMVLRSVRTALEQNGEPVIPNLSVAVAVVLGIATILAVVAFINHSAHSMDISEILARVSREAIHRIDAEWSLEDADTPPRRPPAAVGRAPHEVRFDRSGWVQQIDLGALRRCAPEGGTVFLDTHAGRYAIAGTIMCTISPPPEDVDDTDHRARATVGLGNTRTMQHDVSYGLRLLVDIALKALSPGVNDPTTAQDAIFHAAAVLLELLRRNPVATRHTDEDDRLLVLREQPTHGDMVRLTFDEARRAATDQPTVCIYLLEALELLHESLRSAGLDDRLDALADQARLIVAGCEAADLIPPDLELVRATYEKRFGSPDDVATAQS